MNSGFNLEKAAFILVAAVIVSQLLVGLAITGGCLMFASDLIQSGSKCVAADGKVSEIMAAALAAALAFAGRGKMEK
jgi:hypothetical protein